MSEIVLCLVENIIESCMVVSCQGREYVVILFFGGGDFVCVVGVDDVFFLIDVIFFKLFSGRSGIGCLNIKGS